MKCFFHTTILKKQQLFNTEKMSSRIGAAAGGALGGFNASGQFGGGGAGVAGRPGTVINQPSSFDGFGRDWRRRDFNDWRYDWNYWQNPFQYYPVNYVSPYAYSPYQYLNSYNAYPYVYYTYPTNTVYQTNTHVPIYY